MVPWKRELGRKAVWGLLVVFLCACAPSEGWPWVRNMFDSPGPQPQEDAAQAPPNSLPSSVFAAMPVPVGSAGDPQARLDRGEMLYTRYCAACHGERARGKELTEDYLTPDLTEPDYVEYLDEDLYTIIMDGGINMPGYSDALSESDCWLVIEYTRQLQESHEQ